MSENDDQSRYHRHRWMDAVLPEGWKLEWHQNAADPANRRLETCSCGLARVVLVLA
jgi:hypothetical protein